MKIIRNLQEWQDIRKSLSPKLTIGFSPTMGNLHKGHTSLFEASRRDNDLNITSLFINPTQFNNNADFNHYPKTLEADIEIMEKAGVDYCLLPEEKAIYPLAYRYRIEETQQSLILEGEKRPGHFNGVLTVVMILFHLVKPTRAYFGEKDYQQYLLIQDMIHSFFLDIEMILCPTIREKSGLAFSSRNNRLTPNERCLAEQFAKIFHHGQTCDDIKINLLEAGIHIDYVTEQWGRRFAAVYIGEVRLIDNYTLL